MPGPLLPQVVPEPLRREQPQIEERCREQDYSVLLRLLRNEAVYPVVSLGGGGAQALAGNAALAAILEELGARERVREIWGTSAGAIIGAAWASGARPPAMLEMLEQINRGGMVDISRWELLAKGALRWFLFRRLPEGLVRGRHFREAIAHGINATRFEELQIPLRIVTVTDDGRALPVVHREGPLVEAVEASICLPGIAMPCRSWTGEDHGYFDGGMAEKTPLLSIIGEHQRRDRREELLILCTHFPAGAGAGPPRNFLQRFISAMYHLENRLWEYQAAEAQGAARCRTIVLKPRELTGQIFDFQYIRANYLSCRRAFKRSLSNASIAAAFSAR